MSSFVDVINDDIIFFYNKWWQRFKLKHFKRIWIHVILEKNLDHLKMWELKLHLNQENLKFFSHFSSDSSLLRTSLLLLHVPHFFPNDHFSRVTLVLPSSLFLPHSVHSFCGGFFSLAMTHSRSPPHALFYSLGFCSPHFVHHSLVSLLLIVLWFFPSMSNLGFITLW